MVRRRRRAGGADRLFERLVGNRAGCEGPDRPTRVQRLERRLPEQVVVGTPDEVRSAPRRCPPGRDPADQRGGHACRLAHHQTARGRDLVRERDDRRLQLASGVVGGTAQVDQRRDPGDPDRDVDHALAPCPPEGVRDHDPEVVDPERCREGRSDPFRRAVRVDGQQGEPAAVDVGGVHAGVGTHEAVARRGDREIAATRHHALRLSLDPGRAVPVGDHAALRLRDDLLRHDDDVAAARAQRAQRLLQHRRDVVAGPDLGETVDRQDLHAHPGLFHASSASAARATASARSSSSMIVSVELHRMPRDSTRATRSRSTSSSSQAHTRSR